MSDRKRIGIMLPAADGTAEPDFQAVFNSLGVGVHSHRLWQARDLPIDQHFERMNQDIEPAARYLSSVRLDLIAYCCTTGSFMKGPGWDEEMVQLIERVSGVPAIATSPSVVTALQCLGAKKLSVITPYPEWSNRRLRKYLEAKGFEVLNLNAHPKPSSGSIPAYEQNPQEIVEFGLEHCRPEADVLFCSCTDWRAMEVAEKLEELTGKPVVTSNQANIWVAVQKLGISKPIQGCGRLLREPAPALSA